MIEDMLDEVPENIIGVKIKNEETIVNIVSQTEKHSLLTERLVSILNSKKKILLNIEKIRPVYSELFGDELNPMEFGCSDVPELLESMSSTLRIVIGYENAYVTLVDRGVVHQIGLNVCRLLMEYEDCSIPLKDILQLYLSHYGLKIDLSHLQELTSLIQIEKGIISLTPLLAVAKDIRKLLQHHNGQVSLLHLTSFFQEKYGVSLCSSTYGFTSIQALLENLSDYFTFRGSKHNRFVCLNIESIAEQNKQRGTTQAAKREHSALESRDDDSNSSNSADLSSGRDKKFKAQERDYAKKRRKREKKKKKN